MLIAVLVFLAVAIYTFFIFNSKQDYRRKINTIKSAPAIPLVGHAFSLGRTPEDLLNSLKQMWIDMGRDKFLLKIGMMEQIILTKPKDVEKILSSQTLLSKNLIYKFLNNIIGESIINVERTLWKQYRKLLVPAFHYKVLESYTKIFKEEGDELVSRIIEKPDQDVDMSAFLRETSLKTILKVAMGFDLKSYGAMDNFVEILNEMLKLGGSRIFSLWKNIDFIYFHTKEGKRFNECSQNLSNLSVKLIELKREELKEYLDAIDSGQQEVENLVEKNEAFTNRRVSFLDLLLLSRNEKGQPLKDKEIIDNINTLIVAGFETVSTTAAFALYNLATHPDIQKLVYEEQVSITGGDLNQPITTKELNDMKYLDCVVKETLRIYTPVILFGRTITEDTALEDGSTLPNGSNVLLMPYLSHIDPEQFPDPDKFNPNRFIENPPSSHMYFPFSSGIRDCIGKKMGMQESKFWVATILRSMEVLPPKGEAPRIAFELTLKSMTGVNIRWRKRS